jgi:segregation and condensation protein B
MSPDIAIEGLLFYKSQPLAKQVLAERFSLSDEELADALAVLRERLRLGAMRLVETDTDVQLMTAPELSPLIESVRRDEWRGDIGKAGAETLAIILYRGPLPRAEIDRIRGVNSSFILRSLLARGLVERRERAERGFVFAATPALLAHLGITHRHELPDFAAVMNALDAFKPSEEGIDTAP